MNINQIILEALSIHRNLDEDPDVDISQANFLIPFRRRNPENKIRAPEFAYKVVYNKMPPVIVGTSSESQKIWNNMLVDDHLPTEILENLNSIPNIEIRSVCEGHNKDRIAYVIFRPFTDDVKHIEKITNKLQQCENTYAGYDLGNGGKYRICVATRNWYNKEKTNKAWTEWWNNIPSCIRRSL